MSLTKFRDMKVVRLQEEKDCVSRGGIWNKGKGCMEVIRASHVGIWGAMESTISSLPKATRTLAPVLIAKLRDQMGQAVFDVCKMGLDEYNVSVARILGLARSAGFNTFPASFKMLSQDEANALRGQMGCVQCRVGDDTCPPGEYCQGYIIGSGDGKPGDPGRCVTRPSVAPPVVTPPTAPPVTPPVFQSCSADGDCSAGQHCADNGNCITPLRDCKPGEDSYTRHTCKPGVSCQADFQVCVDELACGWEGHVWADGRCDRSKVFQPPKLEDHFQVSPEQGECQKRGGVWGADGCIERLAVSPEQGECQKRGGIWGADGCIERLAVDSKAVTSGGPVMTTVKWALVVGLGAFSLVYLLKSISGVSRNVKKRRSR